MSTTPLLNDSTLSSAPYVDPLRERRKKNIAFLAFLTFLSILGYVSITEDGGLRSESIIDQSHKLSFNDQSDTTSHQDTSRQTYSPTAMDGEEHASLESRLKYLGGILSQSIGYTVNEDGAKDRKALLGIRTASSTNAVFSSWSESSVYVEATNSLHPSRPSTFGPHLLKGPLEGLLLPITAFSYADSYGCGDSKKLSSPGFTPPTNWIALSQRGHCPFSQKVRYAESLGAIGLIFGDQSFSEGGVGGTGGLLTPWSPDDTSDITIPSAFISRASYVSLLKTYEDEQKVSDEPKGLLIVMSQEELLTWPLLDFLILLLFLPSVLTIVTVFAHRVRLFRQQKLERAPQEAVAKLHSFVWKDAEKRVDPATGVVVAVERSDVVDEERIVGLAATTPIHEEPSEATPLLHSTTSTRLGSLRQTVVRYLPAFMKPHEPSSDLAPRRLHNFVQNEECSICLSNWEDGDRVIELPCGHLFHEEEIRAWLLESKRLCPVCRASITVEDNKVEVPSSPNVAAGIPLTSTPPPSTLSSSSPLSIPPHLVGPSTVHPIASSSSVTLDSPLRR